VFKDVRMCSRIGDVVVKDVRIVLKDVRIVLKDW
jgi:hypothetical protein